MKKLNILLLALGAGFLGYLIWSNGAVALWHQLRGLGWALVPFLLGETIAETIHTVGWRHCLAEPYRSLSWWHLFRIRMAGYAINYTTPTACVGGEVTRAVLLASVKPCPGAISGVLIEKVCFAFTHVLFVAFGSIFVLMYVHLTRPWWLSMVASYALVTVGVVAFLILQKRGKLGGMIRMMASQESFGRAFQKTAINLTSVDDEMRAFYSERREDMWKAVSWHFLGFSLGIFTTWYFLRVLNQNASLGMAAAAWSLGMWFDLLTFAVPMNAGSLEGGRLLAIKAVGFGSLTGITYGVALRLAQILCATTGMIMYAYLTVQNNRLPGQTTGNADRSSGPDSASSGQSLRGQSAAQSAGTNYSGDTAIAENRSRPG